MDVAGIKVYSSNVDQVVKDFDVVAAEITVLVVQLQARFWQKGKNSEKAMKAAFNGGRTNNNVI